MSADEFQRTGPYTHDQSIQWLSAAGKEKHPEIAVQMLVPITLVKLGQVDYVSANLSNPG